MSSAITLIEAVAVGIALMFTFALVRRLMRSPSPSAWISNDLMVFTSALLLTAATLVSVGFEAYAMMPFVHSAFWSSLIAFVLQICFWAVARVIIPIGTEAQ